MMIRFLLTVLLIWHSAVQTAAEIFTSIQDLTEVFSLERRVVNALSTYLQKTEEKLKHIKTYLREYEQVQVDGEIPARLTKQNEAKLVKKYSGNPIHVFNLIKRLTVDWKKIQAHEPYEDWKGVERVIFSDDSAIISRFPREEDLHGAAQAIIRLQTIYQLNTSALVQGTVLDIRGSAELKAQDCLYMGKHSFNMGMYKNSIEWFEQAYRLADLEKNATVSQSQVLSFLNTAIRVYAEEIEEDSIAVVKKKAVNRHELEAVEIQEKKSYKLGKYISMQDDMKNFEALCRGEHILEPSITSRFKCYYDRNTSDYFTIMPAKVEVAFDDPKIVIFHDVIYDSEIEILKTESQSELTRALVLAHNGKGNSISNTRTSKVAWLDDYENLKLRRLNKRISSLTGLSVTPGTDDAEFLQVANYGTGGHYYPHHDYLLAGKTEYQLKNHLHPKELELGDRIATFMFYLSDVKRGGATAFPRIGAVALPRKGSAAFWYNLKKSGKPDTLTLHGACPVAFGSKWVSNKWIRERNQFRHRPCSLHAND